MKTRTKKLLCYSTILSIETIAYYVCIYLYFTTEQYECILLSFIYILGVLSCYLVRSLAKLSSLLSVKTLATFFYSKAMYEFFIIARILMGVNKKLDICLLIIVLMNILRGTLKNSLSSNFSMSKKMESYGDIIKLEKLIIRLMSRSPHAHFTDEMIKSYIVCVAGKSDRKTRCSGNYDPRILFGILCDNTELNAVAEEARSSSGIWEKVENDKSSTDIDSGESSSNEYNHKAVNGNANMMDFVIKITDESGEARKDQAKDVLDGLLEEKIVQGGSETCSTGPASTSDRPCYSILTAKNTISKHLPGKISVESISRLFDKSDSSEFLRLLTQGFDEYLTFEDFYENMRQINIERRSFANFLQVNEYILKTLNISTWVLFMLISIIVVDQVFGFNNFMKFLIYPLVLFMFPWFVNLLDSFIFIIYIHPYDIEDRVLIDSDNLIVKSIGLTSTVLERWNNEVVIYSNRTLKDKVFRNVRRSKNQQKMISVLMRKKDIKKIEQVRRALKEYAMQNPAFEGFNLTVDEIIDCSFVRVDFRITHSINHQNGYFMWVAQNRFMKKLAEVLKEKRIKYHPIEMPIEIEKVCV